MKIIIILFLVVLLILSSILHGPYILESLKLQSLLNKKNKNNFRSGQFKKRKIAFLTAEDRNLDYIKLHDWSFEEYCKKNGYEYIRLNNCEKSVATTYWCKIFKVNELLSSDKYDYVVWVDSDTIIVNKDVSVDSLISKYGEKDIIIGIDLHIVPELIILNMYNAGVFFIKNSDIGKNFLSDCIKYLKDHPKCIVNNKEQGLWAGICYEQGVMNTLLKEKYSDYVYVDNKCDIIYTPLSIIDKNINPLILHLAGKSNQKRYEIFKNYLE